ncbi:hypothetical protein BCR39DRAFT_520717 [Naematelia encephala]|uniref:Calponin-homology (CH) domain-containing protein n=1 Tax=Naematelia encephala TaxID=71784 RepID=A0A1Y2BDX2_9TREE|nr:hypothetical protein BCR39DRAFT_520717 [Naematelia encephala]
MVERTDNTASGQIPLPPLKNPKYRHISRSAAKRESVQLLGSIKDLQLRFSQAGLEHRPGSGVGTRGLSSLGEQDEDEEGVGEENRPPGRDERRKVRDRRPWKEVDMERVDPEVARREVRERIEAMKVSWGIYGGITSSSSSLIPSSPVRATELPRDTRDILVQTAQTIRRVRSLSISISHQPLHSQRRASTPLFAPPRGNRPRGSISTPSRPAGPLPRAVSYGAPERRSSLGLPVLAEEKKEDSLADLRKSALEVLASLRGLEERLRILPLVEHASFSLGPETLSPVREMSTGSSSMTETETETGSTAPTSHRPESSMSAMYSEREIYSDEEDEYNLNVLAQDGGTERHIETWEERIVLEGREYEKLQIGDEKDCVRRWIGAVERLFFGEESLKATEEAEEWVLDQGWENKSLDRAQAFLVSHLPLNMSLLLSQPGTETFQSELLSRLSDGYILSQAFNAALHRSSKAWGFIPDEDIHDTLASAVGGSVTPGEDVKTGEKEWTFRRAGNLTCWAAALRLRYQLPIHLPSQTTSSSFLPVPTKAAPSVTAPTKLRTDGPKIEFDPLVVAKRSDGWEVMLSEVVCKWVEEVARERREEIERS